jgi:hypothetical protein
MKILYDNKEVELNKIVIYDDSYVLGFTANNTIELKHKNFEILSACRVYAFPYNRTVEIISAD